MYGSSPYRIDPGERTIDTIDTQALDAQAAQLAQEILPPGWEYVASSPHTRVARHPEEGLHYKEFLPRSPLERVKAAVRGSRATRARRSDEALGRAGFDAPLAVHQGRLPGGGEYLFTRTAPGESVTRWLSRTRCGDRDTLRLRRELLVELGTLVGRLHATGFVHGDLRPGNVLADRQGDHFRFTLLDNERTRRMLPPSGRALLRNLMQLNMLRPQDLSRSDRMRFFRAWCRQMRDLTPEECALLGGEAYRWAMRRMQSR